MLRSDTGVISCNGYYQYPGHAARQAACLTLRDASLTLHLDAGDRLYTLPQLEVTEPLDTLPLAVTFPDGGRFMPASDADFRQWYSRYRKPGLIFRLERSKSGIIPVLVGTVLVAILYVRVLLPWLSAAIAGQLPVSVEQQLGRYSASFIKHQGFSESKLSSARQKQLQTLFSAVTPAEITSRSNLRLRLMHFPGPANALMLPDGTMILSDELVALAKSEDALVSVMLHEIGHYHYRHSIQMAIRSSLITISLMWVTGDVSGIGDTLLQSAVFVNEMQFSRAMEREADDYAITYMKRQGRSLVAMRQIFSALGEQQPEKRKRIQLPDWLSTHPAMKERVEHIGDAIRE